ncbi:MAG: spore germination protein GerW family protein [Thermoleophilia bacterium]|nr:spore germination protein GerW family protein [Thermoleophilia bacterium]
MPERPDIREVVERLRTTASDVRASMRAQAAFAEPVTQNGLTILPAASVRGGFGGGGGGGAAARGRGKRGADASGDAGGDGEGTGMGMGFGVNARPVGAYVISDDKVHWKPAIDPTRMFIAGCLVAVAYFFFAWLSS